MKLLALICGLLLSLSPVVLGAEGTPESRLIAEVQSRISDITDDEKKILSRLIDERHADVTGEPLTLRAVLIADLCRSRNALSLIPMRGLHFENVVITGDLDLSFVKLQLPLSFDRCRFSGQKQRLSFRQGSLVSLVMNDCVDVPGINARGLFVDHSFLFESHCTAEIDLKNADIGNDLDFEQARLTVTPGERSAVYARNARIGGDVVLDQCAATATLDLRGATIGGMLSAHDGHFQSGDEATVSAALDLVGVSIGRDLELEGAQVKGSVNLTDAYVSRAFRVEHLKDSTNYWLNLTGMRCSRLVVDQISRPLPGHLKLGGCIFDDFNISGPGEDLTDVCLTWLRLPQTTDFSEQPYERLAVVLKQQGKDDIAREVLIAKVEARPYVGKVDRVLRSFGWMVGYGYSPLRAVWIALAVVTLGYVVFKSAYRRNFFVNRINNTPVRFRAPNLTLFMYSIDVFVPLVDFGVGPLYVPGKVDVGMDAKEVTLFRIYYWFHVAAGWLICTVAVAGLSGLIRG